MKIRTCRSLHNSLVNETAPNGISGQVAYATAYHNVLASPTGPSPSIHPFEPSYLWAEAGTNFGIFNDDDPFADIPPNSQDTSLHVTAPLTIITQEKRGGRIRKPSTLLRTA